MKLSVIILNYNVRDFLRQCILSVQAAIQNMEAEIIIIDNNSPDDSCAMVKKEFPDLLLIENKENIGFGRANNQAVAQAKGEYICILNPDTAVAHDVFRLCLDFIQQKPDCGAIGVRLIDGTGNFLPESKRNLPTPMASLKKLLGSNKQQNAYYATYLTEEEIGPVAVLVGAFMFMKRSLYEEVGGFDRDYFMYGEDIDLSYKIEKAGYKNYYLGSAYVLHYKGESTQRDKQYLDRFYGAMHIFYKKHFSKNILFDALIHFGISVTKYAKRFSINKKTEAISKRSEVFALSNDLHFIQKLEDFYAVPVQPIGLKDLPDKKLVNAMVVWDANEYDYRVILENMRFYVPKKVRYRIRPKGTEYIVGSDRSDDKGVVDFI